MRIGYIVPSFDDTTGWGRWVNDFLGHIVEEGVEPTLWAPQSSKAHASPLVRSTDVRFTVPELFDSLRSARGLRAVRGAGAFLGSARQVPRLDAVHSLDAYPWCLYGHFLAKSQGVPHVITAHGRYGYLPYRRLVDRLPYQRVLRSAAAVIAVSDAVRREILKHFATALASDRALVLLNAVDAGKVAGQDRPVDGARARPMVLSATRFIRSKGIATAVEAFALVKEAVPDAEYVIAGPGNSRTNACYAEIDALIRSRGIGGITIAGRVSKAELAELYRRSSLLLHTPITLPDDFEAYGLILLEAGVFGLPVVASDSGGHPEVIEHGVNGLLVPERDAAATASAVVDLLTHPEKARAMGARNREVALARNWPSYCAAQMTIYRQVVGSGDVRQAVSA